MMLGLAIHFIIYASVCGACVAVWALTDGSFEAAWTILSDPKLWDGADFWPIWVIVPWGAIVAIHAGITLAVLVFGAGKRRQRRRLRKAKLDAKLRTIREQPATGPAPDSAHKAGPPRRQWVSVMFVDIAGSTELNAALGDELWSQMIADYRELVRTRTAARGGAEVGTQGDGVLMRFPTPAEAVLCGIDVQTDLRDSDDKLPLQVRIGVHAGEAVEDDGDLIGKVINLAARVTSEASPGEILVTEPVADYLGTQLQIEDRGLHALKGVDPPRHLLAIVWGGDQTPNVSVTTVENY